MTNYQVLKHVYDTATCKIATTKVGKPCLRTKARATSDKLNEVQVKGDKTEGPLPTEIISYSIAPATGRPIHENV